MHLSMVSFQTLPVVGIQKMLVKFDNCTNAISLWPFSNLGPQDAARNNLGFPKAIWPEASILVGPVTGKKIWINFVGNSC